MAHKKDAQPDSNGNKAKPGAGMFKAFSAVKMPSLPDINKAMDMQKQNMANLKEAQTVLSEMMKDIAGMNMAYLQKNAQEMQVMMKGFVEQLNASGESMKQESVKAFNAKIEEMKQQHAKLLEQVKGASEEKSKSFKEKQEVAKDKIEGSKSKFMDMVQGHIDKSKDRHAQLHEKWKQVTQEMNSRFQVKAEEAKTHQKGAADVWQESTKRIMDLMKSTTAQHSKGA